MVLPGKEQIFCEVVLLQLLMQPSAAHRPRPNYCETFRRAIFTEAQNFREPIWKLKELKNEGYDSATKIFRRS